MARQLWTREQDLAVLYLKIRYQGELASRHPAVSALAGAMNRTDASIWMRKANFDSLDPSVPGAGLSKASMLTVDIWAEYERDSDRTLAEARGAYRNLVGAIGAGVSEGTEAGPSV